MDTRFNAKGNVSVFCILECTCVDPHDKTLDFVDKLVLSS